MITLTPTAAQEVKRLVEKEQKPNVGLRVGIKGGGCSGMTYILSIDEATPKQYDTVFEQDGIKILIDAKSRAAAGLRSASEPRDPVLPLA
ncbi:MAG: iron-sulfur cluster assembly accessory protein [Candidatus Omnitrophica bacterium]|nr:iron-sulfur cluster assembly accessory protein [Candidatus Omnitrophota bacterium]